MSNPPYLWPFISYKGSKWQLAPYYPGPENVALLEPFAGGAGYACYHYRHMVTLLDTHERVANIWSYLRHATKKQILALPGALDPRLNINETLPHLKQVERDLIGYWLDKGSPEPRYKPSRWSITHPEDMFWPRPQSRIASQVQHIRHWQSHLASFESMHDVMNTTIFIDPPYQLHGSMYTWNNELLNYDLLRDVVLQLHWSNQVIVTEGEGANWLPFEFFCKGRRSTHSRDNGGIDELIWYRAKRDRKPAVGCGFDLDNTTRFLSNILSGGVPNGKEAR